MTFGRPAFAMLGSVALMGCSSVEIREATRFAGAREQSAEQHEFVARTNSWYALARSEPKLLRAAARHCGLPDTQIARETIRHGRVYGIFTDRMMQFSCPVPERDMK
jgi:hypothetical protein